MSKNYIDPTRRQTHLVGGIYEIKTSNREGGYYCYKTWKYIDDKINLLASDKRAEGLTRSSERNNSPFIRFRKTLGYKHNSDMYLEYIAIWAYIEQYPNKFKKDSFEFDSEIYEDLKLALPIIEKMAQGEDKTADYSKLSIIHKDGDLTNIIPENLIFKENEFNRENAHHMAFMLEYFLDSDLYHSIIPKGTEGKFGTYYESYMREIRRAEIAPLYKDKYPNFNIKPMGHNQIRKASKFYVFNENTNEYESTSVPFSTRGFITKIKNTYNIDCEKILRDRVKNYCTNHSINFRKTRFAHKRFLRLTKLDEEQNKIVEKRVPYFETIDINNFEIVNKEYYNIDGSVYNKDYYESLSYTELLSYLNKYEGKEVVKEEE